MYKSLKFLIHPYKKKIHNVEYLTDLHSSQVHNAALQPSVQKQLPLVLAQLCFGI